MNLDNTNTSCTRPIDAETLADYWLAVLNPQEEQSVEEHLLDCDSCGTRLREVIGLAEGIRELAREGVLRMVVSDVFLQRAAQEGLRVRQYAVSPGGAVGCTVTAEDDILIGRLAANMSGIKRADLSICDEKGTERLVLRDIPLHSGKDSVILQESITFAKASPSNTMIVRLVGLDESGSERILGEYTFNHTRTLPGPGNVTLM
jgi:hypothetical protein